LDAGGRGVGVDDEGNAIFATKSQDNTYWNKNWFSYFLDKGTGSEVPEPPSINPPPMVRLKRYYFSNELALFQLLGVQPPDDGSEINLR
jgi:hypothetical protein